MNGGYQCGCNLADVQLNDMKQNAALSPGYSHYGQVDGCEYSDLTSGLRLH